ncbi:hypothetical protein HDU76_014103 [Blyttiomyces sp. JEL0837]|nr:hypothetical protein HDU76_014103 [Blyttiomyces sp. JEL0837]
MRRLGDTAKLLAMAVNLPSSSSTSTSTSTSPSVTNGQSRGISGLQGQSESISNQQGHTNMNADLDAGISDHSQTESQLLKEPSEQTTVESTTTATSAPVTIPHIAVAAEPIDINALNKTNIPSEHQPDSNNLTHLNSRLDESFSDLDNIATEPVLEMDERPPIIKVISTVDIGTANGGNDQRQLMESTASEGTVLPNSNANEVNTDTMQDPQLENQNLSEPNNRQTQDQDQEANNINEPIPTDPATVDPESRSIISIPHSEPPEYFDNDKYEANYFHYRVRIRRLNAARQMGLLAETPSAELDNLVQNRDPLEHAPLYDPNAVRFDEPLPWYGSADVDQSYRVDVEAGGSRGGSRLGELLERASRSSFLKSVRSVGSRSSMRSDESGGMSSGAGAGGSASGTGAGSDGRLGVRASSSSLLLARSVGVSSSGAGDAGTIASGSPLVEEGGPRPVRSDAALRVSWVSSRSRESLTPGGGTFRALLGDNTRRQRASSTPPQNNRNDDRFEDPNAPPVPPIPMQALGLGVSDLSNQSGVQSRSSFLDIPSIIVVNDDYRDHDRDENEVAGAGSTVAETETEPVPGSSSTVVADGGNVGTPASMNPPPSPLSTYPPPPSLTGSQAVSTDNVRRYRSFSTLNSGRGYTIRLGNRGGTVTIGGSRSGEGSTRSGSVNNNNNDNNNDANNNNNQNETEGRYQLVPPPPTRFFDDAGNGRGVYDALTDERTKVVVVQVESTNWMDMFIEWLQGPVLLKEARVSEREYEAVARRERREALAALRLQMEARELRERIRRGEVPGSSEAADPTVTPGTPIINDVSNSSSSSISNLDANTSAVDTTRPPTTTTPSTHDNAPAAPPIALTASSSSSGSNLRTAFVDDRIFPLAPLGSTGGWNGRGRQGENAGNSDGSGRRAPAWANQNAPTMFMFSADSFNM